METSNTSFCENFCLCLKGKLLSHEVMIRRGWQCDSRCMMCDRCNLETTFHLLFQCEYAINVWRWYHSILGFTIMHGGRSVQQTVSKSCRASRGRVATKVWGVHFFSVCWIIWKERNRTIFEGDKMEPRGAAHRAWREALLWLRYSSHQLLLSCCFFVVYI